MSSDKTILMSPSASLSITTERLARTHTKEPSSTAEAVNWIPLR